MLSVKEIILKFSPQFKPDNQAKQEIEEEQFKVDINIDDIEFNTEYKKINDLTLSIEYDDSSKKEPFGSSTTLKVSANLISSINPEIIGSGKQQLGIANENEIGIDLIIEEMGNKIADLLLIVKIERESTQRYWKIKSGQGLCSRAKQFVVPVPPVMQIQKIDFSTFSACSKKQDKPISVNYYSKF